MILILFESIVSKDQDQEQDQDHEQE